MASRTSSLVDDDGLGKPGHQVAAPDLRRLLLLEPEGAAELYLELLGRLDAHSQLVLLLDVGADGVVYVVAGYADRGLRDDAAKGDHGDLARAAADVYDHGPLRLVDRQPRAYRRSQRLLDGVGLARPGRLGRLLDGPSSTPVTPEGTQTTTRGPIRDLNRRRCG